MSIRNFLTTDVGLYHLFMLNDSTRDAGSLGLTTTGSVGSGGFVAEPICEGVTNSYRSDDGGFDGDNGFVIENTTDINLNMTWNSDAYSMMMWFTSTDISVPTCVYEQGGGTNNMAINVGIASAITSQAADAGEDFLIAQSKFLAEPNRKYFVVHNWEHHSFHAGSTNRISLIINGVLQQYVEGATVTANFPNHSGNASAGNSPDALQSYNGSTQNFASRRKNINMIGLKAFDVIDEVSAREIFERSVQADIVIGADTVANQQAQLDLLIGNSYSGINCAIRIIQATDEKNYRLFVDNIQFQEDPNLRDIAIQFVGDGTLTLENVNGSNTVEVSTPFEVDLFSSILVGDGNIIILDDNRIRLNTQQDQTGVNADKLIIEVAGTYNFIDSSFTEVENVSGGVVTLNLSGSSVTPTLLTETYGTIELASFLTVTDIDGDPIKCIAWDNSNVNAGTQIFNYTDGLSHSINTDGVSTVRVIVDKAGYYARVYILPITSSNQTLVVNMQQSPVVNPTEDISALIAATTMSLDVDPYGLGFDVLRATLDIDILNISAAQWRRFHDYFSEDEAGLTILGLSGLNGDEVYNTNESGVAILKPVLEVYAAGTRDISTLAFIDVSVAQSVFPPYDYTPRNADNVAVEAVLIQPLVDYALMAEVVREAVWNEQESLTTDVGSMKRSVLQSRDHSRATDAQTQEI